MAANERPGAEECPACGARIPPRRNVSVCPACGSPLGEGAGRPGRGAGRAPQELDNLLNQLNDRLAAAGAEISDRAFNLSCGLGFFLLLAWGVAVYFISGRNWLVVIISLIIFSLAVLWIAVLITDISRNQAIARVYRDEVEPEIDRYGQSRRIEIADIGASAHSLLPEQAPLLRFMPAPVEIEEAEEP